MIVILRRALFARLRTWMSRAKRCDSGDAIIRRLDRFLTANPVAP
jgi:hypothetical protein